MGATYDFLSYLNVNAEVAEWITGAEGSTFIEITRETMDGQVRKFQSENKPLPKRFREESNVG